MKSQHTIFLESSLILRWSSRKGPGATRKSIKICNISFPRPEIDRKIARGCEVAAPVRRRRRCALAGPPNWAALRLSHTHARPSRVSEQWH